MPFTCPDLSSLRRETNGCGYVMVRIGRGHHLADKRGRALEHRVVAELMLGRPLRRDEHVHHKNHVVNDNRPQNLEVLDPWTHARLHSPNTKSRKPGEPNLRISCACGCGGTFHRFDANGRPRKYLHGHNQRTAR